MLLNYKQLINKPDDGVTKDIATLQQYLSSAKPNKQNQKFKTNTTTQPITNLLHKILINITEGEKRYLGRITTKFKRVGLGVCYSKRNNLRREYKRKYD